MTESNVEAARRGYDAMLRGDLETIGELLAPDVKWHGGDPSDPMACHDRVEALMYMQRARQRKAPPELVDVVGVGDNVVVILRPPPAGDGPSALSANLSRFRDGKVVEMIHFDDPDAALSTARAT